MPKAPRFISYLAALIAGALALIRLPRLQALQADETGQGSSPAGPQERRRAGEGGGAPVKIAITLVAALLAGAGFVLQQHAAEQAPKSYFLRLRLITSLLHRPRWIAGVAVMAAGQLLSAWAIGHVALSLAEPLLTSSLIFALALAVPLSGQRLRAAEVAGRRAAKRRRGRAVGGADRRGARGVVRLLRCLARRRRDRSDRGRVPDCRDAPPRPAAGHPDRDRGGLVFGVSDALTRRTVEIMDAHPVTVLLTGWPLYCLVAASLAGFWLMESSFNAAPLHASLPAITAAEPVAGMLLGVVVFGDVVHLSPGMLALQAAGIVALVAGVILVARAPALSRLSRPAALLPRQAPGQPAMDARRPPANPLRTAR